MSRLRPLRDRILVRFDPAEDGERVRPSGVIMPAGAVDHVFQWGRVLALGSGLDTACFGLESKTVSPVSWDEVGLHVGDWVCYIKYLKETHTGQSLRSQECLGSDEFLIHARDVVAVRDADEVESTEAGSTQL
jgi:co-chaperonin GroES (HSP10)